MLHQAAEQALQTLVIIAIGMRVVTHSIDRLIRYHSMASCDVLEIFPHKSGNHERLFSLLQNRTSIRVTTTTTIYLHKIFMSWRYGLKTCGSYSSLR